MNPYKQRFFIEKAIAYTLIPYLEEIGFVTVHSPLNKREKGGFKSLISKLSGRIPEKDLALLDRPQKFGLLDSRYDMIFYAPFNVLNKVLTRYGEADNESVKGYQLFGELKRNTTFITEGREGVYIGFIIRNFNNLASFMRSPHFINTRYTQDEELAARYKYDNGVSPPSYEAIQLLMDKYNLSPRNLGEILAADIGTVFSWLTPPAEGKHKDMPIALWELLLLKLGEHPYLELKEKQKKY